jgi:hypothetical protein
LTGVRKRYIWSIVISAGSNSLLMVLSDGSFAMRSVSVPIPGDPFLNVLLRRIRGHELQEQ